MDDTSTNNAAVMMAKNKMTTARTTICCSSTTSTTTNATALTTRTTIARGSTSYTPAPLPLPPPENGYVVSLDNNGSRMILHMPVISSNSSNTTNTSSSDMIVATTEDKTSTTTRRKNETMLPPPDTVVQYERQLRKIQAASRASTPLCKTQLHILHNDESLVVVNKPSGVLTVPGIHSNPSILTMLYDMFQHEMESAMKREHMIVHRLDMDTSGIVVFAKTKEAMSKLQSYFRDKKVSKYYEALLCGHIHDNIQEGIINLPLQKDHRFPPFMRVATPESERAAKQVVEDLNHAGWKKIIKKNPKPSETIFQVIGREYVTSKKDQQNAGQQYPVTRVRLIPVTGRTHQLRVHCAAMGHPILGDPTYGIFGEASPNGGFEDDVMDRLLASTSRATLDLQLSLDKYVKEQGLAMCLHARELRIAHPRSGEALTFVQPPNF